MLFASYVSLIDNLENEYNFEFIRLEEAPSLAIAFEHARDQAIERTKAYMDHSENNREVALDRCYLSVRTGIGAIIDITEARPDSREYKSLYELVGELPEFSEE